MLDFTSILDRRLAANNVRIGKISFHVMNHKLEPEMQKIRIAFVAQSKSWIFRCQENIPLGLQIQNLEINVSSDTFSLWRFLVIEILIADWRGHNHLPKWSSLIVQALNFRAMIQNLQCEKVSQSLVSQANQTFIIWSSWSWTIWSLWSLEIDFMWNLSDCFCVFKQ